MSPDHMSTEESVVSGTVRCAEAASSAKEVGSVNCANETEANVSRSVSSRLRGRGFSVLGDSISTLRGWVPEGWRVHYEGEVHVDGVERPQDTWWGRVIDHFDGRLVANSSFSGSVVEGYGFPAGNSEKRITSLLGAQGECPDVVLVYMGINDYGWGGGRNQVMGGSLSASARPEDLAGERAVEWVVGPDALDRFASAYRDVLVSIHRLAPSSEIWCLTLCPATSPSEVERCYKYQMRGIELERTTVPSFRRLERRGRMSPMCGRTASNTTRWTGAIRRLSACVRSQTWSSRGWRGLLRCPHPSGMHRAPFGHVDAPIATGAPWTSRPTPAGR